jgi:hypothetical protein
VRWTAGGRVAALRRFSVPEKAAPVSAKTGNSTCRNAFQKAVIRAMMEQPGGKFDPCARRHSQTRYRILQDISHESSHPRPAECYCIDLMFGR